MSNYTKSWEGKQAVSINDPVYGIPYRGKIRVVGTRLEICIPFCKKESAESALISFLKGVE